MGNAIITHDLINPLFNETGSYSLPFQIPWTEWNIAQLGIDHHAGLISNSSSIEAVLNIGAYRLSGTLQYSTTQKQYISAYFLTGRGDFFGKAKGIYLTDIPYTELIDLHQTFDSNFLNKITDSAKHAYPDYKYVFAPLYMPNFPDDDTSAYTSVRIVNHWSTSALKFNFISHGINSPGMHYAPFFYTAFVITKILEYIGYSIDQDEFSDTELIQTVVGHTGFQNFWCSYADFSIHLPKITITEFHHFP